ncbi:MAG: MFS transporter [bacterium]|nr:MFS transporter [bacterium]
MSTPEPEPTPSEREPEFSRSYSGYVLGVLFVVYVFNFIDRQVFSILLQDIKEDLEVSDTVMGALSGLAFVLFYTLAGIPIARWADRGSRSFIISLSLAVWSAMTAVSGLAGSTLQLALARVGVGIGEAGGSPPSHSLIADLFPPSRRATALSIYATGIYLGSAIAYLFGGYVRDHFDWRTAFLIVGLAGLPIAVLVKTTVKDPTRGYWETPEPPPPAVLSEVLSFLFRSRAYVWLTIAACFQSVSGYAFLIWGPTFLFRVHDMSGTEVGLWFGAVVGIGGSLGAYLGGVIGDRLGARDARAYMYLSALVSVIGVPFAIGFLLLPERVSALVCFIPFYVLGAMYVGPLWSMAQGLARPQMRATSSAVLLFILNLAGLGLGPLVVGFLNDLLAAEYGELAIRYSLVVVALLGGLAGLFFWLASRSLREDLRAAASGSAGNFSAKGA